MAPVETQALDQSWRGLGLGCWGVILKWYSGRVASAVVVTNSGIGLYSGKIDIRWYSSHTIVMPTRDLSNSIISIGVYNSPLYSFKPIHKVVNVVVNSGCQKYGGYYHFCGCSLAVAPKHWGGIWISHCLMDSFRDESPDPPSSVS